MKFLFVLIVMISASAFAIDFNKVTGTFDTDHKPTPELQNSLASAGTFDPEKTEHRAPASTTKEGRDQHINEVGGSFNTSR